MSPKLFYKFNTINHWVKIENKEVSHKLRNRKISRLFVDIFDDDIFSSKASYLGNLLLIVLILLSSLEIILNSDASLSEYAPLFTAIDTLTTIIFSFEIAGRVILAGYINKKYAGFRGKIRYLTSFYGIIDLLSILPFYIGFFGPDTYHWLKILRILRIWRIARYIPAFSNISGAIRRKGDEILVSLTGIFLLSLTISALIFYAEKGAGSNDFDSIISVFVWSIGKYTGDYGSIAKEAPLTMLGKFLATLNGVLGIALFALPAGLLGAAFIEQMEDYKKNVKVASRIDSINNYFKSYFNKHKRQRRRFVTFDELQARFLYTNDEIIESIRKSDNLRFRAVKSENNNRYNDIEIIEWFERNEFYGFKSVNKKSNVYLINPSGADKIGISHFSHAVATVLGYSYLSVEKRITTAKDVEIDPNCTFYYNDEMDAKIETHLKVPLRFTKFKEDIESIADNNWVIIISTHDQLNTDVDLEYGNEKDTPEFMLSNSTVYDEETLRKLDHALKEKLNQGDMKNTGSIVHHAIGNSEPQYLGRVIHKLKKTNVLTVYLRSEIMTSVDEEYYQVVGAFIDAFKETFGDHTS